MQSHVKITSQDLPALEDEDGFDLDEFGSAVVSVGDLNADGVIDLAVGACRDKADGTVSGAVWILFLNADGTVSSARKIVDETDDDLVLRDTDDFGCSLTFFKGRNSENFLVVGAPGDDGTAGGNRVGAVWVLELTSTGDVNTALKITNDQGLPFDALESNDNFGASVGVVRDTDDLMEDDIIAVGAPGNRNQGGGRAGGAIWVLFLGDHGSVTAFQEISDTAGQSTSASPSGSLVIDPGDRFGASVAGLGDLGGDSSPDIAVGASGDSDDGPSRGAVWIVSLDDQTGSWIGAQKISESEGNFPRDLHSGTAGHRFGSAVASLGSFAGLGSDVLAVGASGDDAYPPEPFSQRDFGAVWLLSLSPMGNVLSTTKIDSLEGSFHGVLDEGDLFGCSLAFLGPLDVAGQGDPVLAVGARGDDDTSEAGPPPPGNNLTLRDAGATWLLTLEEPATEAKAVIYNGQDINRVCLEPVNLPRLGTTWLARTNAATHAGATWSFAIVTQSILEKALSFGELLINPALEHQEFSENRPIQNDVGMHAISLPNDSSLIGSEYRIQVVILGSDPCVCNSIELCNAIDLLLSN